MVCGAEADIKAIGRRIHKTRFDALVQLLYSRDRIPESCLLKNNRFPAPSAGLRVRVVILQALPISAAPNTRWPSARDAY